MKYPIEIVMLEMPEIVHYYTKFRVRIQSKGPDVKNKSFKGQIEIFGFENGHHFLPNIGNILGFVDDWEVRHEISDEFFANCHASCVVPLVSFLIKIH